MNFADLDKALDTGDVGSISNYSSTEGPPSKEDDEDKKNPKKKKEGGIFSKGSKNKKFKAWFNSK